MKYMTAFLLAKTNEAKYFSYRYIQLIPLQGG
jgi:hypothetical protein